MYCNRELLTRVLQLVLAHKLLHLVFQMEFELFQTMFFQFLAGSQSVLRFELLNLPLILVMLFHEMAEFFIRLHQVRFDFILCVLFHFGQSLLSGVASPDRSLELVTGTAGSFTSSEVADDRTIRLPRTLPCTFFHDNCVYGSVVVIPRTQSGIFPAMLLVEGNRGQVRLGDFKKYSAEGLFADRCEQCRSNAATPEGRVDGDVQDLRLIGRALAP
jgi:hypothetical protein